tara:strand:- start:1443 stop:1940 length:498 start_codon:yes stop_codon:yes gene_type:complete
MIEKNTPTFTFENQIEIQGQPPFVWNIFRDLENWPSWNPVCLNAQWLKGPSWVNQSEFNLNTLVGEHQLEGTAELLQSDFPWIIEWSRQTENINEKRTFELDWRGQTSIVIDTITVVLQDSTVDKVNLEQSYKQMSTIWLEALKTEVLRNGDKLWNLSAAERPKK